MIRVSVPTFHAGKIRAKSVVNLICILVSGVTEPVYYSKRLLNPFNGVVQILETEKARAVSNDGINWRIQIQNGVFKTPWHELEFPSKYDRYFVYGLWSKTGELARTPIHPTLYQEHVEQSANHLIESLAGYHDKVPFPQKDVYECWLLDRTDLCPVALVNSSVDENLPDFPRSMRWSSCNNNDTSFSSKAFHTRRGKTRKKIHARDILNEVILESTGSSGVAIWVKRDEHGNGQLLAQNHRASLPIQEIFQQKQFPALGIRQFWCNDDEQQLIDDYLDWISPLLLTLSTLDWETRAKLEIAAQHRPLIVDRYYNLYPQVVDDALLKKILVEARLRKSTGQTDD